MREQAPRNLSPDQIREINYISAHPDVPILLGKYTPENLIENALVKASYEIGETKLAISDPVWGKEVIGDRPDDQMLVELARTPAFRRLQSIEQLSLGGNLATMPNSMYFSRWQHIWGSTAFVRKMLKEDPRFDDRQKMVFQLRTLLSDVGHTAFSHLGDWLFQGPGGAEDLHDQDLREYLRVTGIEHVLERYGFSLEETVFPEVEDWVECPSPDLCVDRVDYGLREMLRWVDPSIHLSMYASDLQNPTSLFEIADNGQLVMTDKLFARMFSAGFSILPTEHWSQPVHRLQLQFLQTGIQAAVADQLVMSDKHPRDKLFAIDNSFMPGLQLWEQLHLKELLSDTARSQRRIFVQARRADLNNIFAGIWQDEWQFPEFPDPLKAYSWQSELLGGPYPANISFDIPEVSEPMNMSAHIDGLHVNLPALKARSIDPLVKDPDGNLVRFSSLEEGYKAFTQGQREMMSRPYIAAIHMRKEIAGLVVQRYEEIVSEWQKLLGRERSIEHLQEVVEDVEPWAAVNRFDNIYESTDEFITSRKRVGRTAMRAESKPSWFRPK